MRQLEFSDPPLDRPCKGAALVPEEFTLDQVFRDRRTIDGDEMVSGSDGSADGWLGR